jgi:pimeloyl-ACP methyl ester carboxylesterase
MNVVVDGLMTNYLKVGAGPTLIMLHGWGDSANTFRNLAEELKDEYEIYALDLPGFGGTQKPAEAWGLSDYGHFVKNWIKKIGIGSPYYLAGHSFGGSVAIVAAAEEELKPKKIILLASAGIRDKKTFRKKAYRLGAKTARIPLFILPPGKAQQLKLKVYNRIGSDMLLVPEMRKTFVKTVSEDVRGKAARIKVPTLLIFGDSDKETPTSDGKLLNEAIPNSELKVLSSGHFLHQQLAVETAGLMRDFLSK